MKEQCVSMSKKAPITVRSRRWNLRFVGMGAGCPNKKTGKSPRWTIPRFCMCVLTHAQLARKLSRKVARKLVFTRLTGFTFRDNTLGERDRSSEKRKKEIGIIMAFPRCMLDNKIGGIKPDS